LECSSPGADPENIEAVGYSKNQLKALVGLGGYHCEHDEPRFFYASTYVPFETEHYDFETRTWQHVD